MAGMKYGVLAASLVFQLLLQSTMCNGHDIKDEILKEVRLMLSEMENKLISQFHVSTEKVISFQTAQFSVDVTDM